MLARPIVQLRLEQQFKCPQQETRVVQLEAYMAPKGVPSDALFCFEQGSSHCAHPKSPSRDWRLHAEVATHWSLANVQRVRALVGTGADAASFHLFSEHLQSLKNSGGFPLGFPNTFNSIQRTFIKCPLKTRLRVRSGNAEMNRVLSLPLRCS